MTDCVFIEGLTVSATIGVLGWERQIKQKLVLDIELWCDVKKAATTDDVNDALDYSAVSQRVTDVVEQSEFQLIEGLSEHIAQMILSEFPAQQVKIKLSKPGAVRGTRAVGVSICRSRDNLASSNPINVSEDE